MTETGRRSRPAERPVGPPRRDDEVVDIASEDSFPASDPPGLTPITIGAPAPKPGDETPEAPRAKAEPEER